MTAFALYAGLDIGFSSGREYFNYKFKQVVGSKFSEATHSALTPKVAHVENKRYTMKSQKEDQIARHNSRSLISESTETSMEQRQKGAEMEALTHERNNKY